MPIPFSFIVYDPGPGGAPTTNNPRNLAGRIVAYDDSQVNEYGFESARARLDDVTIEEAEDWTQRLMSSCEVQTRSGRRRFEGFLNEVAISRGGKPRSVSLTNMANRIIVRYTDPNGVQGTVVVSSAASIAQYGTKEIVLNYSTVDLAMATARANRELKQSAFPANPEPSGGGNSKGRVTVELTFRGWADTLSWLTTSSADQTTAATHTHITALLTAYNTVNPFFSLSQQDMTPTGLNIIRYAEADSTYMEIIAKLFATGDSAGNRLFWGIFAGRRMLIRPFAAATPSVIAYYENERTGEVRDIYQNLVLPEDYEPDVMIQSTDWIEPPPPSGAIASLTRKYIKRVTLSKQSTTLTGKLEPDDPRKLADLIAKPVGSGPSGSSAHQAAAERHISRAVTTRYLRTDNPDRYNPVTGVVLPPAGGTGVVNPPTGTIAVPPGGVDLGTGAGIGGSGKFGVSGTGTPPSLTKWLGTHELTNAVSGTDYAPANHSHPLGDVPSAAPSDAKYIVQTSNSTLTNEQALGLLATGILKTTTSTGVLSIAIGSDLPSHSHPHGDITDWNEAIDDRVAALLIAGNNITLTYNDAANTLTVSTVADGTVSGAGTAGRITQWASGGADIENSTLVKNGAGLLTLSAASALTLTVSGSINISGAGAGPGDVLQHNGTAFIPTALTPAAIGAVDGSGIIGRIAQWSDADTLTSATLAKTGTGVLTLATGSGNQTLTFSGTGGGTLALAGNTLTLAANLTTSGGGDITLSSSAPRTLTIPATGTAVLGTGAANQLALWNGTNTVYGDSNITWSGGELFVTGAMHVSGGGATDGGYYYTERDGSGLWATYATASAWRVWYSVGGDRLNVDTGGNLTAIGTIRTASNVTYNFGAWVSATDGASNGYCLLAVNGVVRKFMTRP